MASKLDLKPRDKLCKVNDRDGLYVAVTPAGANSFLYDYLINGRHETMTFGRYGVGGITMAEAREQLGDAKKMVAAGKSPAKEPVHGGNHPIEDFWPSGPPPWGFGGVKSVDWEEEVQTLIIPCDRDRRFAPVVQRGGRRCTANRWLRREGKYGTCRCGAVR